MPLWLLIVLLGWLLVLPASAERLVSADKPIVVRLEVNKPTSIELPENLYDVTVLKRPDLYSITSTGPYVYIHPYQESLDARFFVVGQSGRQYQILFKVAAPADDVVRVTSSLPQASPKVPGLTAASWLRALRFRRPIPGAQAVQVPGPTVEDRRVTVVEAQTLGHGSTLGMTLLVQNLTARALKLDIRLGEPATLAEDVLAVDTWAWPPRLTVRTLAAEHDELGPGMSGALYIVFERRDP